MAHCVTVKTKYEGVRQHKKEESEAGKRVEQDDTTGENKDVTGSAVEQHFFTIMIPVGMM